MVENAFGVLASRWRVYHTKIGVRTECAIHVIKATCLLHNFLQMRSTRAQEETLLQEPDTFQSDGLQDIVGIRHRAATDAIEIRNAFTEYFMNISPVPWQHAHVNRGMFNQ